MQNLNTETSMERLAQLAERAKEYTTLQEEDKVRILNSYAFYLLSKKFSRGFNKLARGFANFAAVLGLKHLEIVKKVATDMERQEREMYEKKHSKK